MSADLKAGRARWREDARLTALPEEGTRIKPGYVSGNRFDLEEFSAGTYPSCSRHGAMNRVATTRSGSGWWRCLELGCNIGCETSPPFVAHGAKE